MSIPDVDEKEIIAALEAYDSNLRDQPKWIDFSQNKNHKYAIKYKDRIYPVKKIISMATKIGVSSFSGGDEANRYLQKKGYEIIEIDRDIDQPLKDQFDRIMGSYILAKEQDDFENHELDIIFQERIPDILHHYLQNIKMNIDFHINSSIGQEKWAKTPWISIMDKEITNTIEKGVYIVYLFSADMTSLYLILMQGVTKMSKVELRGIKEEIRESIDLSLLNTDENIDLFTVGLGNEYEDAAIGYFRYEKGDIPKDKKLLYDLESILMIYQKYKLQFRISLSISEIIKKIENIILQKGFTYPSGLIENFYLALKTKPFVILAGISGTGKTKLVELFAEAMGCTQENGRYQLISVRPDWSDSTDLLGYTDIRGIFKPGPIIDIIKKAIGEPNYHHFVCLDEMNLARVEYYFSDFLSVMETRQMRDGKIKSIPLLTEKDFVGDKESIEKYADLYIPDNLSLVGTVNMDETTHPFSKKVLDRANTIEFSEVDLMPLDTESQYLVGESNIQDLIPPDFLKSKYITLKDCLDQDRDFIIRVIVRLKKVNELLKKANLHIGYRIRDEICFFMLYNNQYELLDFEKAFDYQLLQKILPRIQGSNQQVKRLLVDLVSHTSGEDFTVEEGRVAENVERYIFDNIEKYPYQNSSKKISFMIKRFEDDGFTAYWL